VKNADRNLELAVARLAAAIEAGDPLTAAVALGRERGDRGIAIALALEDLEAVHRIVTGEDPDAPLVRAFAEAWAEAAIAVLLARGALDRRTGLATPDYLATRLRDLARTGLAPGLGLVVADAGPGPSRFAALIRSARVARALVESFPGAETPASVRESAVSVLVPRDEALEAGVARARLSILRIDGVTAAEVGWIALPEDETEVPRFLLGL